MRSVAITITGIDEIKRAFAELPAKVAKKVVRQALRRGLKLPLAAAKADAPVDTGAGRRSLRIRASKGPAGAAKKYTIAMALLIGERSPGKTWYMALQESGYHTGKRTRSAGKVVSRSPGSHKVEGKHYMRRALRETEQPARELIIEDITQGIEREAQKS